MKENKLKENKLKPSVPVIELFCNEIKKNKMLECLILSHGQGGISDIILANFLEDVALYLKENKNI